MLSIILSIFISAVVARKSATREVFDEGIENHTMLHKINSTGNYNTVKIPIVWHILYANDDGNLPREHLESQIDVLNEDFRKLNDDIQSTTPEVWLSEVGNFKLEFYTKKVVRKKVGGGVWQPNNYMKFDFSGGSDVVKPHKYLNIWVVEGMTDGILGYAQFPAELKTSPETDGVVLDRRTVGFVGDVYPTYNLGRTLTHEIGHWLNLRHIWGDGGCSVDDKISDTPLSGGPNYGCPYPAYSCGSLDMTMNFMDYTDDRCMSMFTIDQVKRGRALFAEGGIRYSIATQKHKTTLNKKYLIIGLVVSVTASIVFLSLFLYFLVRLCNRCNRGEQSNSMQRLEDEIELDDVVVEVQ